MPCRLQKSEDSDRGARGPGDVVLDPGIGGEDCIGKSVRTWRSEIAYMVQNIC
jgi:hypothetical protein